MGSHHNRHRSRAGRRAAVVAGALVGAVALAHVPLTSAAFTATTVNPGSSFRAATTWCASPGSVTLTVLNDAEVQSKDPDKNFGNKTPIEVRSHANDDRRIFIRPALPAIPANCDLTSAVLSLTVRGFKPDRTYHAYRATSDWSVDSITWNNQPSVTGAPAAAVTTDGTWEIDVVDQVLGLYANGPGGNYGLRIQDSAEGDAKDLNNKYDSLDGTTPGQVTYTWG